VIVCVWCEEKREEYKQDWGISITAPFEDSARIICKTFCLELFIFRWGRGVYELVGKGKKNTTVTILPLNLREFGQSVSFSLEHRASGGGGGALTTTSFRVSPALPSIESQILAAALVVSSRFLPLLHAGLAEDVVETHLELGELRLLDHQMRLVQVLDHEDVPAVGVDLEQDRFDGRVAFGRDSVLAATGADGQGGVDHSTRTPGHLDGDIG